MVLWLGGVGWGGPASASAGNILNSGTGLSRNMYLKQVIYIYGCSHSSVHTLLRDGDTWYDPSNTVVHVHVHRHTLYMDMKGGMYLKTIIHILVHTLVFTHC